MLWPAVAAVLVCIGLHVVPPTTLTVGAGWAFVVMEVAALCVLVVMATSDRVRAPATRRVAITLTALPTLANAGSLARLIYALIEHTRTHFTAAALGRSVIGLSVTNVIVLAQWYRLVDRGGPGFRIGADPPPPDVLCPRMMTPESAGPAWTTGFIDYLVLSLAALASFGANDALALTAWAKLLVVIRSIVSLRAIGLLVARLVNPIT